MENFMPVQKPHVRSNYNYVEDVTHNTETNAVDIKSRITKQPQEIKATVIQNTIIDHNNEFTHPQYTKYNQNNSLNSSILSASQMSTTIKNQLFFPQQYVKMQCFFYSVLTKDEILKQVKDLLQKNQFFNYDPELALTKAVVSSNNQITYNQACNFHIVQKPIVIEVDGYKIPLLLQFQRKQLCTDIKFNQNRFVLVYRLLINSQTNQFVQQFTIKQKFKTQPQEITTIDFQYLLDDQAFVVKVYDQANKLMLFNDMRYIFIRNDSENWALDGPCLDMIQYQIPEHGLFKCTIARGNEIFHSPPIYLKKQNGKITVLNEHGQLIKVRKEEKINLEEIAEKIKKEKEVKDLKIREKLMENQNKVQKQLQVDAINQKNEQINQAKYKLPDKPIILSFEKYDNTVGVENVIIANFFIKMSTSPMFYIVNQYQQDYYYLSNCKMQFAALDSRSFKITITYGLSDVGALPLLLVEDYGKTYIIPLAYQPIKPNNFYKNAVQQVLNGTYKILTTMIQIESGAIDYSTLELTPEHLLLYETESQDELAAFGPNATDVIHPVCAQIEPVQHPITLQSIVHYNLLKIYDSELLYEDKQFFQDDLWQVIVQNDEKQVVFEETSKQLIVKLGFRYFLLSFGAEDERDFAYLVLMRFKSLLYKQNIIEENYKQIITDNSKYNKNAEYIVQEKQLFNIVNQTPILYERLNVKKLINDCKIVLVASSDLGAIVLMKYQQQEVLDNRFAYRQIDVYAWNMNQMQQLRCTEELLPQDNETVDDIISRQKKKKIIYRCNVVDLYGEFAEDVDVMLHQDMFSISLGQLSKVPNGFEFFKLEPTHFENLSSQFVGTNNFLIFNLDHAWEIETKDELDYLELMTFFGK